jgi:hypothetical protein
LPGRIVGWHKKSLQPETVSGYVYAMAGIEMHFLEGFVTGAAVT